LSVPVVCVSEEAERKLSVSVPVEEAEKQ
jgi:hypothetical protein